MFHYQKENGEITANALTDNKYPESSLHYATGPILVDPNVKAEVVFSGLAYPIDMVFLGRNEILVIERIREL